MNKLNNLTVLLLVISASYVSTVQAQIGSPHKKVFLPPQEVRCQYKNELLQCENINHNYLREVLPLGPIVKDQWQTYTFSSAQTGSKESLQVLFIYKDTATKQRVAIQTSYLPIIADINNKKGQWTLEPQSKEWYTCEGLAANCPITNLPF